MVSIPTSDSSLDESATLEVQPVEDQQFLSALQQLFLEGNIKLKDQESTSGTLTILKTQEKEDEVFLLSGSSSGGPDVTGDSGYVVVIPGTSPYPDYGDYDSPYIPPDEWDANYHDNGAARGEEETAVGEQKLIGVSLKNWKEIGSMDTYLKMVTSFWGIRE